ncbi:hypothetical protein [Metabacillus schmidteae]|nr:hypothetical protein [Metabacillus schmidteae]
MEMITQDPIIKGEWADPFILKDGEDYGGKPVVDVDKTINNS